MKAKLSIFLLVLGVTFPAAAAESPRIEPPPSDHSETEILRPADIREVAERAEKLADAFRSSLRKSLSRSIVDDTKVERNAKQYAKDLENQLDRLRKDAGKEKFKRMRKQVKKALKQARKLEPVLADVRLEGPVESQWLALRRDLQTLAYYYELESFRA